MNIIFPLMVFITASTVNRGCLYLVIDMHAPSLLRLSCQLCVGEMHVYAHPEILY